MKLFCQKLSGNQKLLFFYLQAMHTLSTDYESLCVKLPVLQYEFVPKIDGHIFDNQLFTVNNISYREKERNVMSQFLQTYVPAV